MAAPGKPAPGTARKLVKGRAVKNQADENRRFGGLQILTVFVGLAQGMAFLPTGLAVAPPVAEVKVEIPLAGSVAQANQRAPRTEEAPVESRMLVGAFQLFSGVFVVWVGFVTIGSMIGLYTQAEDGTMVLWAGLGGALGGLVKQYYYKVESWNLLFTLGVQWGATLVGAALKFGILKVAY